MIFRVVKLLLKILNLIILEIKQFAGEGSVVKLQNIKIGRMGVGVASKDGSDVNVSNLEVNNYKLHAVMSYIKKDFYNYPSLIGHGIKINPTKNARKLKKSFMSLNSRVVDTQKLMLKNCTKTK